MISGKLLKEIVYFHDHYLCFLKLFTDANKNNENEIMGAFENTKGNEYKYINLSTIVLCLRFYRTR